jgi:hypothetical protein
MRASLGLPVRLSQSATHPRGYSTTTYIYNMCLLLSDSLKVPLPDLSSNWLTDGSKNPEVLHLVLDVLVASTLEQPQRSGSDVELADVVLVDNVPVAREVGVGRRAFEDNGSHTEQQRCVYDVGVTCDPTYITAAEEDIVVVDVEDVLSGCRCSKEVASGCVHDTLRLAG